MRGLLTEQEEIGTILNRVGKLHIMSERTAA